jgi:hypothetical protein
MTIDYIWECIRRYDHRLTPELTLAIAQKAAREEREACAELCLRGTDMPVQTHALKIIKAERERIAGVIRARVSVEEERECIADALRAGEQA